MARRPGVDLFGRVPFRFLDALKRRDISFEQFAIGCFLDAEGYANQDRCAIYNLMALREALHYPMKRDALRRDLDALRPVWIDFDSTERQRRPYVFRLTGLQVEDRTAAGQGGQALQSGPPPPQSTLQSETRQVAPHEPKTAAPTEPSSRSESSSTPFLSRLVSSPNDLGEKRDEDPALQQKQPWETHQEQHPELYPEQERPPGDQK